MAIVHITLEPPPAHPGHARLLIPKPPATWHQTLLDVDVPGAEEMLDIQASNSSQQGFVVTLGEVKCVSIRYEFGPPSETVPEWLWTVVDNNYVRASNELRDLVRTITQDAETEGAKLRRLIDHTTERFTYDHPESRFNAGHELVPPLTCGITPGNCVHINTYILASLLAVPIRATYIAGYFFDAKQPIADNMHCWIATEADGAVEFWDIAHHQLYGLGVVETALNPAPGTRFAMSAGRGLVFHADQHRIEVSHFAKPIWLFADGTSQDAKLEARITL
ncbi:MAG: hypothetical protein ETSY1_03115 [Candidatus Entotheonella factor]|uniref:Transglutaminase-like domain-containing protein n=1 Tax=Entotheonella factor TaxID=1429438 RepID=W4LXC6_ENTF1|nr:transglutaminase-like domain-containing protein [Candidatus Entotheonella palauensis]ETX02570.1 MAG: hypothetical protein ETSY1_03115 [Candidatus Entotheonella factor]